MKKWHMIIDVEKCEDCNNCFLACKDEHVDNDWPGYTAAQPRHGQRWMNILRRERGRFPHIDVAYRPTPCMHCDDAPCIDSGQGAVVKREDGIVLIDPDTARGRKELTASCPYGAIWWNEDLDLPQKCTFCAHLLDEGWAQPRCVQACPTGALRVVHRTDEEMAAIAGAQYLETLLPERHTRPRVFYRNLHRFNRCFISGTVAREENGRIDCVENARVILKKDLGRIAEAATDPFGDFKFDGLPENSGRYEVEIHYAGTAVRIMAVEVATSVSMDTIMLQPDQK